MVMLGTGLSVCVSATVLGVEARPVRVEVSITSGLPGFAIVGLPDAAVSEARERVRAAVIASGKEWPMQRIVVNLAPAHLRKVGSGFDLAMACGVLAASGQVSPECLAGWGFIGELSLDGRVRPVRGVLAATDALRALGIRTLGVAVFNAAEASVIQGIAVVATDSLAHLIEVLGGDAVSRPHPSPVPRPSPDPFEDIVDVRGNEVAKRALEIAAAGGHNLLLTGAPGAGKTMLARRLPGILPPLEEREAIEVTKVWSIAGLLSEGASLVDRRPFRAPHHSVTTAGLVGGGGATPLPGEVSLAHRGVLFLDELGEFSRHAIQALRQPMEEGSVRIVRARWAATFPARAMIIAATNPCPCGWRGVEHRACRCAPNRLSAYAERLGGPVLDRIDMQVGVPPATGDDLFGAGEGDSSRTVRGRVAVARAKQRARWPDGGPTSNAEISPRGIVESARVEPAAQRLVARAVDDEGISGRAAHRVIRVARTIADLSDSPVVDVASVREALAFRVMGGTDD